MFDLLEKLALLGLGCVPAGDCEGWIEFVLGIELEGLELVLFS